MNSSIEKIIDLLIFIFLTFMTFSISVTQAAFYLAFLLLIILYKKELAEKISGEKLNLPLVLFFLAAVISLIFYVQPVDRIRGAKKLTFFLVFFSYYFFMVRPPSLSDIKKYLNYLVAGFTLTLIYILIQHYFGQDIVPYRYFTFQWDNGTRIYPLYGQFSAIFLMLLLPVTAFSKKIDSKKRFVFIIALLPILATLYLSTSRASVISIIAASFTMLIFKRKTGAILFLLLVLVSTGIFYTKKSGGNLFKSVINLTDTDNPRYYSNKSRLDMLKDTYEIFSANPVTGIGYDGYDDYSKKLGRKHDKIFNDALNVLATMGILGIIPFFWIIYVLIKESYASIKLLKINSPSDDFYVFLSFGIFLSFLTFLVSGLFEPLFFNSKALMCMLILLSINRVITKEILIEKKA